MKGELGEERAQAARHGKEAAARVREADQAAARVKSLRKDELKRLAREKSALAERVAVRVTCQRRWAARLCTSAVRPDIQLQSETPVQGSIQAPAATRCPLLCLCQKQLGTAQLNAVSVHRSWRQLLHGRTGRRQTCKSPPAQRRRATMLRWPPCRSGWLLPRLVLLACRAR